MSQSTIRYAAAMSATLTALPPVEASTLIAQGHAAGRLIEDSGELSRFFASPAFTIEEKKDIADDLARRLELAPLLRDLLFTLVEQRRTAELGPIIAAAEHRYHEQQGIVEVELRAPDPLTDDDIADLRPTLIRLFGERLHIRHAVDRALLGGLVVRTGTLLYDASLADQIHHLYTHLNKGERHDA